ncbi:MAG: glycosyl hydrolase family 28 protein [Planctomycetota bacterium]
MARSLSNRRVSRRTGLPSVAAVWLVLVSLPGAFAGAGEGPPAAVPSAPEAKVVTWPAPAGEATSDDYEVFVAGVEIPVYRARVLDPPFAGKEWDFGGPYSFAVFDVSGPVDVRISSRRPVKDLALRPASAGIRAAVEGGRTIAFRLDGPRKLSVEPDGKNGPLLLFANPIEVDAPRPGDRGVVHFGPGVHKPERIELRSGETLYIAGGAIVKAEVLVRGDGVRIGGRGILDGSDWEWRKGPVGSQIAIRRSSDVEVRDIVIRGSPHWTIVPMNSRRVTIRNVKLCNSRVQNDDGINPCNSQDVLITDCFIRSDDDCVALKGLELGGPLSNVERIVVEDSILWCDRARIFLLGHESRAERMREIALRNLDIIHFSMTAFLFEPGEDMRLEDVKIQDVRVEGEGQKSFIRLRPVVNQYMRRKVPGSIRNVRFERVRLEGRPGDYLVEIAGADPEHDVREVSFEDVSIAGEPLGPTSRRLRVGAHAEAPRFGGAPGGPASGGEGGQ